MSGCTKAPSPQRLGGFPQPGASGQQPAVGAAGQQQAHSGAGGHGGGHPGRPLVCPPLCRMALDQIKEGVWGGKGRPPPPPTPEGGLPLTFLVPGREFGPTLGGTLNPPPKIVKILFPALGAEIFSIFDKFCPKGAKNSSFMADFGSQQFAPSEKSVAWTVPSFRWGMSPLLDRPCPKGQSFLSGALCRELFSFLPFFLRMSV